MSIQEIIADVQGINNKSAEMLEKIRNYIPAGASSTMRVLPYHKPLVIKKAEGVKIWDLDDNELIDYNMGYGPLIFGHRSDIINNAVKNELDQRGAVLGFSTSLYLEAAELIHESYPSVEKMRFSSTGSEVDQTAIRLARQYTGRNHIILFEGHYHGSTDSLYHKYNATPEQLNDKGDYTVHPGTKGMGGAPYNAYVLPWNDAEALEAFLKENGNLIAGIIMEPVMGNSGVIPPKEGYLKRVRELCDQYGIVLIFDEVITGGRVQRGGAQQRFDVQCDITTMSKATIGGFPGSIIGGKKEIMDLLNEQVFHGGVYSGNPLTVAVTIATQREFQKNGVSIFGTFDRLSDKLASGVRNIFSDLDIPVVVQNVGAMLNLFFVDDPAIKEIKDFRDFCLLANKEKFILFQHKLQDLGVYVHPNNLEPWYLSTAHNDEIIDKTLDRMNEAAKSMKDILLK